MLLTIILLCNYNFNLSDVAANDSASYLNVQDTLAADNLHIFSCILLSLLERTALQTMDKLGRILFDAASASLEGVPSFTLVIFFSSSQHTVVSDGGSNTRLSPYLNLL
jgi:hypothetical protein